MKSMVHTCSLSTWEAEAGKWTVLGQTKLNSKNLYLKKKIERQIVLHKINREAIFSRSQTKTRNILNRIKIFIWMDQGNAKINKLWFVPKDQSKEMEGQFINSLVTIYRSIKVRQEESICTRLHYAAPTHTSPQNLLVVCHLRVSGSRAS
jgi:hypothetical protein